MISMEGMNENSRIFILMIKVNVTNDKRYLLVRWLKL